MADNHPSERDDYREARALWNAFRETRQARGINIDQLFSEWAAQEAPKLASPGAREDFAELCQNGCNAKVLAAIIVLIRYSPRLEVIWAMIVGSPEKREKAKRALENTAGILEEIFGTAEEEKDRAEFAKIGRIPPSHMVSELRLYGRVISLAELLSVDTEAYSLGEVAKYILTSYVTRVTQKPHDRNVSGLMAEACNTPDYNEVAQRMWRNRNCERLEKHFAKLTEFLVAMSAAMARPT